MKLKKLLRKLASVKITVFLLAYSIVLVFIATIAQVENNIYYVINNYFRTFLTWKFPFIGGLFVGLLLLINLLCSFPLHFKIKIKNKDYKKTFILLFISSLIIFFIIKIQYQNQIDTEIENEIWRVLKKLLNAGVVALILLFCCYKLFHKKAGLVLIHCSIIFLLIFEIITYMWSEEGTMTLLQDEKTSFIDISNTAELVLIDSSREKNKLIHIPSNLLQKNKLISSAKLPFDIQVISYFKNSTIKSEIPTPLIDKGIGTELLIVETTNSDGVSVENNIDIPSYKIRFIDKNNKNILGTYLVSLWFYPNINSRTFNPKQFIEYQGIKYQIVLRPKRNYLKDKDNNNYSFTLKEFRHEKYIGTNIASSFSSRIDIDNNLSKNHEVNIWMNNPIRYEGKTFYQASYLSNNQGSILQVMDNFGWFIPYLCFMYILVGLSSHFLLSLTNYLKRVKNND